MALSMLFSSARILKAIKKENAILEKIISENKIDIVVSDNRFGLHSKKACCIYMTHQIMIKCPPALKLFEYFLWRKHRSFMKKYDECWIPDFEGEKNLSGDLAHKYPLVKNTFYVGPLSRFAPLTVEEKKVKPVYDVMFIISGPEPQRTIFEETAIRQSLKLKDLKVLIVKGITETGITEERRQNIRLVSHLGSGQMRRVIAESKVVICRPGYSSIMDLTRLDKKAVFVPTPGQTEQIYLAKKFYSENFFFYMKQKMFDLDACIRHSASYAGINMQADRSVISSRIKYLLES